MSGKPQEQNLNISLKAERITFICCKAVEYTKSDYMHNEEGYINNISTKWINPVTGRHECGKPYSRKDIETKAWTIYDDSCKKRQGSLLWRVSDEDAQKLNDEYQKADNQGFKFEDYLSQQWVNGWINRDKYLIFQNQYDRAIQALRRPFLCDFNVMNHFLFLDTFKLTFGNAFNESHSNIFVE